MSSNGARVTGHASAMRRAFDASFALPPRAAEVERIQLLLVRLGPDPHAIRLREISGLFVDRRVGHVPGPLPELLGVASLRGAIVPVYDLRVLLGYPAGPPPRWLVVASPGPVALAFDHLDGHAVVSPDDIVAEPEGEPGRRHARELVRGADGARAILLHIPSVLDDIAARARRARPHQER